MNPWLLAGLLAGWFVVVLEVLLFIAAVVFVVLVGYFQLTEYIGRRKVIPITVEPDEPADE